MVFSYNSSSLWIWLSLIQCHVHWGSVEVYDFQSEHPSRSQQFDRFLLLAVSMSLAGANSPRKRISFAGGFLALALHVFLAAALGVAISQFFSIQAAWMSYVVVLKVHFLGGESHY